MAAPAPRPEFIIIFLKECRDEGSGVYAEPKAKYQLQAPPRLQSPQNFPRELPGCGVAFRSIWIPPFCKRGLGGFNSPEFSAHKTDGCGNYPDGSGGFRNPSGVGDRCTNLRHNQKPRATQMILCFMAGAPLRRRCESGC